MQEKSPFLPLSHRKTTSFILDDRLYPFAPLLWKPTAQLATRTTRRNTPPSPPISLLSSSIQTLSLSSWTAKVNAMESKTNSNVCGNNKWPGISEKNSKNVRIFTINGGLLPDCVCRMEACPSTRYNTWCASSFVLGCHGFLCFDMCVSHSIALFCLERCALGPCFTLVLVLLVSFQLYLYT